MGQLLLLDAQLAGRLAGGGVAQRVMPHCAQAAQEEEAQLAARGLGIQDFDQPHLGRAGEVGAAAGDHLKPADVTHADVVLHRWVLA